MRNALICLVLFSSSASADVIGRWYDDVGSPDYLDARISINQEGSKYFYHRINGDGSQGKFLLIRSGNIYKRADGKFGSIYIITPKGLDIHDRNGYIRTAHPIANIASAKEESFIKNKNQDLCIQMSADVYTIYGMLEAHSLARVKKTLNGNKSLELDTVLKLYKLGYSKFEAAKIQYNSCLELRKNKIIK